MPESKSTAREVARAIVALVGVTLLTGALLATGEWLDRHVLPSFLEPRRTVLITATVVRVAAALLGAALIRIARSRVALGALLRGALAVVVALGLCEWVLSRAHRHAAQERPALEEPLRQPDARLGWRFVPSRTGHAGAIEYAFDAFGERVRSAAEPIDPARPTLLFTGESMVVGHGLTWAESVPGQVEALTGTQSANLAVHGFANDQAWLRLHDELPRFAKPVAVVSLFMPAIFDRNLDEDRPHLGPDLAPLPPQHGLQLWALARRLLPYRSTAAIDRGVAMTREVLRVTERAAHERGARSLIVVPHFGAETGAELALRRRVLDDAGLTYLPVALEEGWRLPGDRHPDARAAHAIAAAIAARLQAR